MARPKKLTVDYFPHICSSGKTLFILESKYGNDGYAFWFKLLELLATSPGHVYDCRNEDAMVFLQAKTRVNGDKTTEVLDLLSKLEAIDRELWQEHQVIWVQKLVDNVADVYHNRRTLPPSRPYIYNNKLTQDTISTTDNPSTPNIYNQKHGSGGVSTSKSTQTKLNKTKLNKTNIDNDKKYRDMVVQ